MEDIHSMMCAGKPLEVHAKCREEEQAARAAAAKLEAKRRKRDKAKDKAKAQQVEAPAAPSLTASPDVASQHPFADSNTPEVATARSESSALDVTDVLSPQASLQLQQNNSGNIQPDGNQPGLALNHFQPGVLAPKPTAVDGNTTNLALAHAEIGPAGPARMGSGSREQSSKVSRTQADQAGPAAPSIAVHAAQASAGRMPGAQAHSPSGPTPTGSSGTRPSSALPQPGGNVARLLRGPHQQGPSEGIPGGDALPTGDPKRKKQRSKKGRQPSDEQGALNPAASPSSLDGSLAPLNDQSVAARIPISGACEDLLNSSIPLHFPAAGEASARAVEHPESIAAAVMAAATGQYGACVLYPTSGMPCLALTV